jgi:N-carbamoyl-L-amino-acid hydrolase
MCGNGQTLQGKSTVDDTLKALRIDEARFRADFEAQAEIGATGDGGVHRPALGEAHLAVRAWFRERVTAADLEFRTDGAGNHSAFLACGPAGAPTLLLGSHLDSVPHGGRFDGPLGVLAALEALRVVQEAGISLPVHLEAIDLTDEEGTLFGELGSTALAGTLTAEALREPRGGRAALEAGLARAGLTEPGLLTARRDPAALAGYIELHIEQGPRLVNAQVDVGVVTGIVGMCSYQLMFVGRADHAGTTSMTDRRDAALGASAFALAAREVVLADFPDCVANVGDMRFAPGAFNIGPAQVVLALEFRAPEPAQFRRLEGALLERAQVEAGRFRLGLEVERLGWLDPAPMSDVAQRAFAEAADALGLTHVSLFSGAGHDAQSLAGVCPVGMVFVPSMGGASHSPREFTRWEDCVNGANVLLQAALRMALYRDSGI